VAIAPDFGSGQSPGSLAGASCPLLFLVMLAFLENIEININKNCFPSFAAYQNP